MRRNPVPGRPRIKIIIPIVMILGVLLAFPLTGWAQTDEELLADLREEVRTFGQKEWADDFGSSMTLVLLGEKAYPVLIDALHDSDPVVRANAANMLAFVPGDTDTPPEYVLEALRLAAQDSDSRVRESATKTLELLNAQKDKLLS